jgi:hypothetical protein
MFSVLQALTRNQLRDGHPTQQCPAAKLDPAKKDLERGPVHYYIAPEKRTYKKYFY